MERDDEEHEAPKNVGKGPSKQTIRSSKYQEESTKPSKWPEPTRETLVTRKMLEWLCDTL